METIDPVYNHTAAWKALLPELERVHGDVAEFGVFNGGSTRILANLFPERTVWAFDTYSGMPQQEYSATVDMDPPGCFRPTYTPEQMFDPFPNVIPVRGRFCDTLPTLPMRPKIAFAYVDCDLFMSAMDALHWLAKHLSPGGIVFLDDYQTHLGIRKAVDMFIIRERGLEFDGKNVIRWPK